MPTGINWVEPSKDPHGIYEELYPLNDLAISTYSVYFHYSQKPLDFTHFCASQPYPLTCLAHCCSTYLNPPPRLPPGK